MGLLSRLEAVNRILRESGDYPVSSLITDQSNDSLMAEAILDEYTKEALMAGTVGNTLVVEFQPDNNGFIPLPGNVLEVYPWYLPLGGKNSMNKRVSVRGTPPRLYDQDTNSFVFTESVVLQYTVLEDFENLPTPLQFAIADRAARSYQMVTQGDPRIDQQLAQQEMISRMRQRAAEVRAGQYNAFRTGTSAGPKRLRRIPRSWW